MSIGAKAAKAKKPFSINEILQESDSVQKNMGIGHSSNGLDLLLVSCCVYPRVRLMLVSVAADWP